MVVVLGHASATDLAALAAMAPRFGDITVIVTRPELTTVANPGVAMVALANDADLPSRWAARGGASMAVAT